MFPPPLSAVRVCNRVDFAVVSFAPSRGLPAWVVAMCRGSLPSSRLTGVCAGCAAGPRDGWVGSSGEEVPTVGPSGPACALEHWDGLVGLSGLGSGCAAVRSVRLGKARAWGVQGPGSSLLSP